MSIEKCSRWVLSFFTLAVGAALAKVPPPSPVPPVPHRDVMGREAENVVKALEAVLQSKQLPSVEGTQSYDIPDLGCRDMWVPVAPTGYDCAFTYRIGKTGPLTKVSTRDGATSKLAENLFAALHEAGATYYDDPAHGAFMSLKNMTANRAELHFDDLSTYHPPPTPNVTATGALAQAVLRALDDAGIDDQDGTLLLICDNYNARPRCSYQLHGKAFPLLDADRSAALWTAVKDAAVAAGYKPFSGKPEEMTLFNARSFTFDGATLGLVLTGGKSGPPPRPPHT